MKKFISYIILLFLLFSCEKKTDWKIKADEEVIVVVEGIILNKKNESYIKLTKQAKTLNEIPDPISKADVVVFDGKKIILFNESTTIPGLYKADSNFIGTINKVYYLSITYQDKVYSANDYMIACSPFESVKFKKSTENNKFFEIDESFVSDEPAIWEIYLDWSHINDSLQTEGNIKKAILYYYTLKTIDVSQGFAPDKNKIIFPAGTKVVQKKYSLSNKHAEFIRTMLSETEWRGYLFDVTPANTASNLTEGAVGFFGASIVISTDTMFVK